ncbi:15143_t:CDS:1, partial [Acaulospora morrowiae]
RLYIATMKTKQSGFYEEQVTSNCIITSETPKELTDLALLRFNATIS